MFCRPAIISGIHAKKKTISLPVKYGLEWKLTVRNRLKEMSKPPIAAILEKSPIIVPIPTASSPSAITKPIEAAFNQQIRSATA